MVRIRLFPAGMIFLVVTPRHGVTCKQLNRGDYGFRSHAGFEPRPSLLGWPRRYFMIAEGGTLCAGLPVKAVLTRCSCLQGVRNLRRLSFVGFCRTGSCERYSYDEQPPRRSDKGIRVPTGCSRADYCRVIAESGVLARRRIATVVTACCEHYAPLGVTPRRYSCASTKIICALALLTGPSRRGGNGGISFAM